MVMIYMLGDSIRIGMQKALKGLDDANFQVEGPKENLGDSRSLLEFIKELKVDDDYTLYFNAGLHDIRFHREGKSIQVSLSEYSENINQIIEKIKLKKVASEIFIGTTTPFDENQHNELRVLNGSPFARYLRDLDLYNDVLKEVALKNDIQVLDLNTIFKEHGLFDFLKEDGLHLNEMGYEKLGKLLVNEIKKPSN